MLRTLKAINRRMTGGQKEVAVGLALPLVVMCPWLLAAVPTVMAAESAAEAASGTARGIGGWFRRRKERKEAEEAARQVETDAERRREDDAKLPKPPTKAEIRAALRQEYEEILREIDGDPYLHPTEETAAREEAKRRYLKRLDEVM